MARPLLPIALGLAVLLPALAGCFDASDPTSPDAPASPTPPPPPPTESGFDQTTVSNNPGAFSYGGQAGRKTATETHAWQNAALRAGVNWGGQVASGSVSLVVKDAADQEVHRATFGGPAQGGSYETTGVGLPGSWSISIAFDDFSGQMGLTMTSS